MKYDGYNGKGFILQRSFLKWAGSKFQVLSHILPHVSSGKRLFEPFIGSGTVFLNTDFDEYHLGDTNVDLINLYQTLQTLGEDYINKAADYFKPENNDKQIYLKFRQIFNDSHDKLERAYLFLYLNRHSYNGLCRYNSKGKFNVPFGSYKEVVFPYEAIYAFYEKSKRAQFYCSDFSKVMLKANQTGDVIYADPPYYPLSASSNFTGYSYVNFKHDDQSHLAMLAEKLLKKQVKTVISNQVTPETLALYKQAELYRFDVRRMISCQVNNRNLVEELLAIYTPIQLK